MKLVSIIRGLLVGAWICRSSLSLYLGLALTGQCSEFVGTILDADTSKPIPARIYLQSQAGHWFFVGSDSDFGSALPYDEQWVPMANSVEKHTTISAHPFRVDLEPGTYEITIERGKEYFPKTKTLILDESEATETFRLKRWVNMAARSWYSGETHVHRRIQELPNVMLAEDLNVAFPVTFWTINAFEAPHLRPSTLRRQGPSPFGERRDVGHQMVGIDETHVYFPRNTEYEIFSIGQTRHVLGALFVLNHKTTFQRGMPPVGEIAEQAHREGALLDLDKHSWPWSMMLIPIAKIDLYELSNNSVWRTEFGFRNSSVPPAEYMRVETDRRGMTELGWLQFGFENYYALLNCGFRLRPTAGTASGVHPVPLGYSRVYVRLDTPFTGEAWIQGLREGRSFVTTGPMLFATVDAQHPGAVFKQAVAKPTAYTLAIESISERPIDRLEILVNGIVEASASPQNLRTAEGAFSTQANVSVQIGETSWIAVRSFQPNGDGRHRFAHTAPWHVEVNEEPIRPRRVEIDYLIKRIEDEIERNQQLLPDPALNEYRQALRIYQSIAARAR